jgi:hypothetical protein
MKTSTFIAGIAALFLATGTAHAQNPDDPSEEYDKGVEYDCGDNDHDQIWIKREHVLSTTTRTIITMDSDSYGGRYRNGKRTPYPTIRFNKETGKLTLNNKPCRPIAEKGK